MNSQKPILVTGAAGFVGSALVRTLLERGEHVIAVTKTYGRKLELEHPSLNKIALELPDISALLAVTPPKVIIHAAAVVNPKEAEDAQRCQAVNTAGTLALGEWALSIDARFIYVSSIAAMGFYSAEAGVDENSPCKPTSIYGRTKLAGETALFELKARGLKLAIIRPPTLYGPEDSYNFLALTLAIKKRRFVLFDGGRAPMSIMSVKNLIAALVVLSECEAQGVFLAADGEPTSLREIAGIISQALGRKTQIPSVPKWLGYLVASVIEPLCLGLGVRPPLSWSRMRTLTNSFGLNIDRLRKIGYQPVENYIQAIQATVAGYRRRGLID